LQGIKRGIMEMSDLLVINKADGNNMDKARQARTLYQGALELFPPSPSGWKPLVLTASAIEGTGLRTILEAVEQYMDLTKNNGYFQKKRAEQAVYWMRESIDDTLLSRFYSNPRVKGKFLEMESKVREGETDSFSAAAELLKYL